jgi:hypothetical protein
MGFTIRENLEIVMKEVAVGELTTVRIDDQRGEFQRLATLTGFNQGQEERHPLAVPVRNFAERRTGIMNINGFDILRVVMEPLLDLVIADCVVSSVAFWVTLEATA